MLDNIKEFYYFAIMIKLKLLLVLCGASLLIAGCSGDNMSEETKKELPKIVNIAEYDFTELSNKVIYFGHQSVGFNIVDGLMDIKNENDTVNLKIQEISEPKDIALDVFAHSRVGKNRDPISKINAFSNYIKQGVGEKADIAFFKFCYVDFNENTDINSIFNEYKNNMLELEKLYPETSFVHVTVPLITREKGIKTLIKKILGRSLRGYEDNLIRESYNNLLREEYSDKATLFDLARIESTRPDGVRKAFFRNGKKHYALLPEYTDDGGHLNEKGRKIVAEQLLIKLLEIAKESE